MYLYGEGLVSCKNLFPIQLYIYDSYIDNKIIIKLSEIGPTSMVSFEICIIFIFINDLPLYNPNHNTDLFADDSTISATGKSKLCISKTLNTVLEDISHWCYENIMVLNVSKTKTMCIGSKQKRCTSSDEIFDISINDLQINESQGEKVIGVFVDATFS